jgi:hypothetical protein
MLAQKAVCNKCHTKFYYPGYPAYFACPKCKSTDVDLMYKKQICECCNGTGEVTEVIIKKFSYKYNDRHLKKDSFDKLLTNAVKEDTLFVNYKPIEKDTKQLVYSQ